MYNICINNCYSNVVWYSLSNILYIQSSPIQYCRQRDALYARCHPHREMHWHPWPATPRQAILTQRRLTRRWNDATRPQFRCVCRSGRPCRMFHPSQRWHQGESPRFQHGNPPGKSRHPDMTSWFFTTRLRWPCADPFFLRSQPILPSASHNPDKKSDWFVQIFYVDYLYRYIYISI